MSEKGRRENIDLTGLPAELVAELSISSNPREVDKQIVAVIDSLGGSASLDAILVGMYRAHGTILKRRALQSKLYRLKGAWAESGVKGVYTTTDPNAPVSNVHHI